MFSKCRLEECQNLYGGAKKHVGLESAKDAGKRKVIWLTVSEPWTVVLARIVSTVQMALVFW
jgi:hypothetical protein